MHRSLVIENKLIETSMRRFLLDRFIDPEELKRGCLTYVLSKANGPRCERRLNASVVDHWESDRLSMRRFLVSLHQTSTVMTQNCSGHQQFVRRYRWTISIFPPPSLYPLDFMVRSLQNTLPHESIALRLRTASSPISSGGGHSISKPPEILDPILRSRPTFEDHLPT